MDITLTTPALLFSAISLLMLAFTNRFLTIASLIRQLHTKYLTNKEAGIIKGQIDNLRQRLHLIRNMQLFGVLSFLLCVLSMIAIFFKNLQWGSYFFTVALFLFSVSLLLSLKEIYISTRALELELSDME